MLSCAKLKPLTTDSVRIRKFQPEPVQVKLAGYPGVRIQPVGEIVGQLLLGQVLDLMVEN
jgi:hypothetical protein